MYKTLVEAVLDHGRQQPQKLAVAFKDETLTYGSLCEKIKAIAALLADSFGVCSGDLVMLSAVSKPEYIAMFLGIQYLGAVSVPIDKSLKKDSLQKLAAFVQPKLVLTDSTTDSALFPSCRLFSLKQLFLDAGKDRSGTLHEREYKCPEPDSICEILFTTGTTGEPKGAMLSCQNVLSSSLYTIDGIGMREDEVVLVPLPINHSFGMRVVRATLYLGATLILQNGFTFAKNIEENILRYSCTAMVSAAASIELLERQMGENFAPIMSRLRYIEFSAGSITLDQRKKLISMLPNTVIHNTWGSTETGGAIFLNVSERQDKLNSIGKPIEGVEMRAVDPEGKPVHAVDVNTAGRMSLRGPMQMQGYYHLPDITARTLQDGWLLTSDMVYTDDEGFIYMLGRADDIINVGGEKVSPLELENVAGEYAGISDCACIGVPDPKKIMGSIPAVFFVPGAGYDEKAFRSFLSDRLERFKMPQEYVAVTDIPRNRMGKIDRKALHVMWENKDRQQELMNPVIQAILTRRSIRSFTQETVPRDVLEMIVKAGFYAPSGHNMQTWHFTIVTDKKDIEDLKQAAETTAKAKGVYFYGFQNPTSVILVSNDVRAPYGCQDCSAAVENMMLAAHSFGLGSVWVNALMTLRDESPVKEVLDRLGVPANHKIWATMALGYPTTEGSLLAKKANVWHFSSDLK